MTEQSAATAGGSGLNRSGAKAAALNKEAFDDDLQGQLSEASSLRIKLAEYQHVQDLRKQDLGWMGTLLGGEKNAPIAVAAIVLIISVASFIAMHITIAYGSLDADRIRIIVSAADKCLALATLALGYVCGKSS